MFRLITIIGTALALYTVTFFALAPASAQGAVCGPRSDVIEVLESRWGESQQSLGFAAGGNVLEMWASTETGTWTTLITRPDGQACIVASGEAFQIISAGEPA